MGSVQEGKRLPWHPSASKRAKLGEARRRLPGCKAVGISALVAIGMPRFGTFFAIARTMPMTSIDLARFRWDSQRQTTLLSLQAERSANAKRLTV